MALYSMLHVGAIGGMHREMKSDTNILLMKGRRKDIREI
jgi:hypothetical protein